MNLKSKILVPHSRPTIDESEILAVSGVLRSGNIAQGEMVGKFEQELARYIGVKGGVATASGTTALHLALLALNITDKDTVALPSYVCTAVLNAVHYTGATPLLIDIHPDTFNIDVYDLKKKLTARTKAVLVPHAFGLPADMDEIMALGLPVIEDCAQSIGAAYNNKMAGSFGDISVFSFYATKMMTTGEGGMVVSNSEELLEKVRDLRDYCDRENYKIRYNYKMTDMQASMGISQLKRLNQFIKIRQIIAQKYDAEFKNYCDLPINVSNKRSHLYYRYIIKPHSESGSFLKLSKEKGINCERPVFKPLHRYLNISGFSNTDAVWEKAVSVPIYPTLTEEEINKIIECVKTVSKRP
jgi:dTDP-4-amino-4,6-dideoxygalactose transaminase